MEKVPTIGLPYQLLVKAANEPVLADATLLFCHSLYQFIFFIALKFKNLAIFNDFDKTILFFIENFLQFVFIVFWKLNTVLVSVLHNLNH